MNSFSMVPIFQLLVCSLCLQLLSGFSLGGVIQRQPRSSSTSLSVGALAQSSPEYGLANLDEKLLIFIQTEDETTRRADFESFVRTRLEKAEKRGSGFKLLELYFVEQVTDELTRLGHTIQDQSWERYVTSGFEEDAAELLDRKLWACVDMLIQFKILVKKIGGSRHGLDALKKKGGCGKCHQCSCSKKP